MRKTFIMLVGFIIPALLTNINAQDIPVKPTKVSHAIYHDVIGPLSDFPSLTPEQIKEQENEEGKWERNEELKERLYPFAETATPQAGKYPAWQTEMGTTSAVILQNFSGQLTGSNPPDCNGTVGPNHYMQTINVKYTIYDKLGNLLAGPTNLNTLFQGVPGATNNDGDPVILYDDQANRYMVAEFSGVWSNPDYMLIAVSQTDDPTGLWDRWSFVMNGFPDYMKFGIWNDGYYMGTNTYSGDDIYVFERAAMLSGSPNPKMVQFNNPNRPNSGFHCVLPVDADAGFAPIGRPGMFMTINDNAWGGSSQDQLWIYELNVDWTNTNNSTFSRVQQIDVEGFDTNFGSTWANIPQPGTGQKLDAIPQILMHRVQYRNYGDVERIVCQHTIDVDGTNHAGIRWYELELNGSSWDVRQHGTFAPDNDNRWMGSIAMNDNKDIAIGYSVSSSSTYPSIRFTGQSGTENALASGVLDITEESIFEGTASQTSSERWGDYANMAIDPVNDHTFWFTTQYNISAYTKGTKVAAFEFAAPLTADFEADNTSPVVEDTVAFTDLSVGDPTSWQWIFTPTTVTFVDGTTDTTQNPKVRFDAPGYYSVELEVSNGSGTSNLLKTDYINTMDFLVVTATATPDEICEGESSQLGAPTTGGSGFYTYSWSSDPAGFTSSIMNPIVYPMATTTYFIEVTDGTQTALNDTIVYVNPLPVITLGTWPDTLCNDNSPVQLTADPSGGIYSGNGVNTTGLFTPAQAIIGWNAITYTYEDANGCIADATDSIFVDNCTGIGESLIANKVKIFPNPNNGEFTIESKIIIDRIVILDQTGKAVYAAQVGKNSINLNPSLQKGIYIVRIYSVNKKQDAVNKELIVN